MADKYSIGKPVVLINPDTGDAYAASGGGSDGTVTGNVAAGAADSGNPVKVGGVFNSALPTLTTGQRGDVQLAADGRLLADVGLSASALNDALAASSGVLLRVPGSGAFRLFGVASYNFNGASFDRQRGDVAGTYVKAAPRNKNASALTAATTTSQQLFAADPLRSRLIVQNLSATDAVWINLGAPATAGAGSIRIPANSEPMQLEGTTEAVNIIAAAGTPAITAWVF